MITKFISIDFKECKDLFFNYLDMNRDKLVCETDLFKLMKSMKDFTMSDIIIDDLMLVLKKIEQVRVKEGKHDQIAIIKKTTHQKLAYAAKNKSTVDKENHVAEVKNFLREVKEYQDRIKKKKALRSSLEDTPYTDQVYDLDPLDKEIVIPASMKTLIDKEINFDLFVEMLTDKVDKQRVRLDLKMFSEIEFSKSGLPNMIVEIMWFLTRAPRKWIIQKKLEQLVPELVAAFKKKADSDKDGDETLDEKYSKEVLEMNRVRLNFGKYIDFERYEQFFRLFCRDPYL